MAVDVDHKAEAPGLSNTGQSPHEYRHHHFKEIDVAPIQEEALRDAVHIELSWRSWVWKLQT